MKKRNYDDSSNKKNPEINIPRNISEKLDKEEVIPKEEIITKKENKINNNLKEKRMSRAMERLKK